MSNVDCTKLGHDISSISSSIKFKTIFYKVLSNNLAELKCKKCISIYKRSLEYDLIYSGLTFPDDSVFFSNWYMYRYYNIILSE